MSTVQLEFAAERTPLDAIDSRLAAAGVAVVPGFEPVPMRGLLAAPDTVLVTVLVPPGFVMERLRNIPGVLRVIGDLSVGPLD